jgi:hypothetical protein
MTDFQFFVGVRVNKRSKPQERGPPVHNHRLGPRALLHQFTAVAVTAYTYLHISPARVLHTLLPLSAGLGHFRVLAVQSVWLPTFMHVHIINLLSRYIN